MGPDAVAFVGRVLSDGWQSAVSGELARALNDELWHALSAKSGNRVFCRNLAYIARELEKIVEAPKRLLSWAVRRAVRSQGASTIEAEIARALVDHAVGDSLKLSIPHLGDAVRTIRVTGVWSCLQADLSLEGCECFKDLASDKPKELMKAELEAKIDGLVRA
ncbi:hypothetical protein ACQPX6_00190 [Actinomycetospora sp. CA-101289]|uniref:hypothetical protein n=1 Tax=Actinomycetospora sp. CA-101289 TaxID=3239893 RepID=UPI003D99FC10